jgi:hypothetical protein
LLKRSVHLIGILCLALLAVSPAQGGPARAGACGGSEFSYAGLQSNVTAHGVAATLAPIEAPSVVDGHVGGWVGVGGTDSGPGGVAEWLQVGFAAFSGAHGRRTQMYYEVTRPGKLPRYVELAAGVKPGAKHRVAVLEMANRKTWWRVWVDGRAVSPPIHLPGSHGTWYPQVLGENWNGGTGTCNGYAYRFTDVTLAETNGGKWKPLLDGYLFNDRGYRVRQTSAAPRSFVATSV